MDNILKENKRKQKYIICSIIILTVMIIIALIFMINFKNSHRKPEVKEDVFTFSYLEEIPTNSDAYLAYGDQYEDVSFDPALFSMKEIGEYEVAITFADQSFQLKIQIIDDQAPEITFLNDHSVDVYRINQAALIENLFTVSDVSDFTYEYSPDHETIKDGIQNICVTAQDTYGNKQESCKEFAITLVDLTFADVPQADSVEELVNQYIKERNLNERTLGFFYCSPDDGETYVYNGDTVFNAASTIKVPLSMLYFDRYESGEMNPQETIMLTSSDIEGGDGMTLDDYPLGSYIPYSYLQKQSIIFSDNTATNLLIKGLGGFTAFRNLLPDYNTSNHSLPSSFYTQNVITMNYMLDVMHHLYANQDHYKTMIAMMKQASAGEYLQRSTDAFEIAQKYGLFEGYLHTTGIVYTPKPYIVGIYTSGRADAYEIIPELNRWLLAYQLQK